MLLAKLNERTPLPRTLTPTDSAIRRITRHHWQNFLNLLRFPRPLTDSFFVITETKSQLNYLDQVTWNDSHIAGYDIHKNSFRRLHESEIETTVLDCGYVNNGLLQGSNWLLDPYLDKLRADGVYLDFILPSQLNLPTEILEHFMLIAERDPSAPRLINSFSLSEIHQVPFYLSGFSLEEFCLLGYAVANNNIEYVKSAATQNVCFNTCQSFDGRSPLHLAVEYGSEAMLRTVLAAGGNINALDAYSYTPLETAVHLQKTSFVECLLSHNADPNFGQDAKVKSFDHATTLCEMTPQMYSLLKAAGARFDVYHSPFEDTPLHYNAKRFRRDTFIAMVKDGLDPHSKNADGMSPLDVLRNDVPIEMFKDVLIECEI